MLLCIVLLMVAGMIEVNVFILLTCTALFLFALQHRLEQVSLVNLVQTVCILLETEVLS